MDEAVVQLVQSVSSRTGVDSSQLNVTMLMPSTDDLVRFSALKGLPLPAIQARYAILKYLNRLVTPLLNYVDLTEIQEKSTRETPKVFFKAPEEESKDDDSSIVGKKPRVVDDWSKVNTHAEEMTLSSIIHSLKGLVSHVCRLK